MSIKRGTKPDTYLDLVKEFPLASIQSDQQLEEASRFLDALTSLKLDRGARVYVGALSDLIERYEDRHVKIEPPAEGSMLEFLMDQHGINQADLSRATGISKSVISEVLKSKRALSKANIAGLSRYFKVERAVFLPE